MRIPIPDEKDIKQSVLEMLRKWFVDRPPTPTYRAMSLTPDVADKFLQLRDRIMNHGNVERGIKEMIAVRVSLLNNCNPCLLSHMRKLKSIYGEDTVKKVSEFPESEVTDMERAILEFVDEAVENKGEVSDETFNQLKKFFSHEEIVEIVEVICLYMFLNMFNKVLDITE